MLDLHCTLDGLIIICTRATSMTKIDGFGTTKWLYVNSPSSSKLSSSSTNCLPMVILLVLLSQYIGVMIVCP
jgi:hypothetical protein